MPNSGSKRLEYRVEWERAFREQLRQIVTHAPVAMAMLDREGRHLAHSTRWLRYLGTADPSVVGRTAFEAWPGMPEKYRRVLERALAGEVVELGELARERCPRRQRLRPVARRDPPQGASAAASGSSGQCSARHAPVWQ